MRVFVEDSAFFVVFLLVIDVAGVFVDDSAFCVGFSLLTANIKRKIIEKNAQKRIESYNKMLKSKLIITT